MAEQLSAAATSALRDQFATAEERATPCQRAMIRRRAKRAKGLSYPYPDHEVSAWGNVGALAGPLEPSQTPLRATP
jgi:hypothetical protein